MIIKNNFNAKNANPLDNYQNIGKGQNSLDKHFEQEKQGIPLKNVSNDVIQDILDKDKEYQNDDKEEDKWDFFR